jgi:hypothetical protein
MSESLIPQDAVLMDVLTISTYMFPTGEQGVVVQATDLTLERAYGLMEIAKLQLWNAQEPKIQYYDGGDQ